MKEKILLDTDPGSDIDDAVCIAYLLANPQCDLLGITTVTGEGEKRARIASSLCKIAQQDVPIYVGAEQPLLVEARQTTASQAGALDKWDHDTDFPRGQALQFMRDTIRANPGEVTLLAIGPFTNVAMLFTLDPELPGMLKQLVVMGGRYYEPIPEWNAMLDPHAAAIIYKHKVRSHTSIGTDVTLQVTMHKDEVRRRFETPLLRPVLDFAQVWFEHSDKLTFHDPLTAVSIFYPQVCAYECGTVTVNTDLNAGDLRGVTSFVPGKDGYHQVAKAVDVDLFFDKYFDVFVD